MKWKLIFLQQDYSTRVTIIFPCCLSGAKKKKSGRGGREIILQLMAEESEPYCNHKMTHLEEIALHIALPWASIILTLSING